MGETTVKTKNDEKTHEFWDNDDNHYIFTEKKYSLYLEYSQSISDLKKDLVLWAATEADCSARLDTLIPYSEKLNAELDDYAFEHERITEDQINQYNDIILTIRELTRRGRLASIVVEAVENHISELAEEVLKLEEESIVRE